jgi:hypothetical protein
MATGSARVLFMRAIILSLAAVRTTGGMFSNTSSSSDDGMVRALSLVRVACCEGGGRELKSLVMWCGGEVMRKFGVCVLGAIMRMKNGRSGYQTSRSLTSVLLLFVFYLSRLNEYHPSQCLIVLVKR